ncbi:dihydrolipoyllysine-residue succinyltransferase component of 2-oxoglutarate dehydrogenase complex, mitochondrial-like [Xenia sp. Carnegie-2017]|uniref:dihydrolipoyllysine-residue succinyltransferase component of 2-oxoglutarate dehydrogenase complex, mitochondrial-like n=1 Tax=Xenia sp. Carnegie-2017 TaxID=2897299 RepID=UPI001F037CCB|nr:dihydrolipoyllysine-residue succinyltransferase component of 2-oxoglutarate dehydrogenase complex, mitochondrial-like [Xenia sp. Carnegie-2017]
MLFHKTSSVLHRTCFRGKFYGLPRQNLIGLPRTTNRQLSLLYYNPRQPCRVRNYNLNTLRGNINAVASFKAFHTSAIIGEDLRTVKTPPFPDSVTEGDIRWEKEEGEAIEEDEVIGEIETDKTALPVTSPVAGVIKKFLVDDGSTVEKGQDLLVVDASGEGGLTTSKVADETEQSKVETPPEPLQPKVETSERTAEKVVPREIPSAPPPVPEIPKEPLKIVTPTPPPLPQSPPSTEADKGIPGTATGGNRNETRVKMTRMRLRIAGRLKEAQNTTAMLTTFNEVDMSNIMEMRAQHKEAFFKKHNVKLGFMSAFIKASAHALQELPVVNAVIDDDDNQIIYRDYIDISVAVATPKGLVVPVIRNVETMNFADIEKTINALGEKARDGSLAIEDMDGGTFTISNGGVFGSLMGTPIINPPQSAILGIHAINDRPVALNGKVEIRPMMYLALTYDHRLIDGREAVTFLRKIKTTVEDPRKILLDL